jgi:GTPase
MLDRQPKVTNNRGGSAQAVWISAARGTGIPLLLDAISTRLRPATLHGVIHLSPTQGRQRARLFDIGAVLSEQPCDDGGWNIELEMAERDLRRFLKREHLPDDLLEPLAARRPATA